MISKVIERRVVTVDVGSIIALDVSGRTERLLPSDWDRAAFRFPNPIPEWREKHAIACNVQITGRTFQYRYNSTQVKVRIEWVHDDEPSTYGDGWLIVNVWDCPRVEEDGVYS